MLATLINPPRAIIGLGNPGKSYENTRHNIGFKIVEAFGQRYNASWSERDIMEIAKISVNSMLVILIKPQTFMNTSGRVLPFLIKHGIMASDVLVVHDELELPFGKIALKFGGSAKGHNGLKSIISNYGDQFARLRFGIGRPDRREDVPEYVLQNFREKPQEIALLIEQAANLIEDLYSMRNN